ncbi:MAG: DUF2272 domain-containing protein [Variovorax sp.]|nr:DUF2272 domain-containing protein [Variovorax sp.]
MRQCLPLCLAVAALSLGALLAPESAAAAQTVEALCSAGVERPAPPRALKLAALAQREHAAWGSPALDAQGRLLDAGSYEAEDTPRSLRVAPPWQRVIGYWEAVDADGRLPSQVRFGALRPADRRLLQQALQQASASHLQGLGVGPDQGLSSAELRALQIAIDRVAVVDTPWSAAFVSWLAREAGLQAEEFAFSEAHADYAGAAWAATQREQTGEPTPYALRTCDLTHTTPRVGDLVCQARGSQAELDSFDKLGDALARREAGGGALPMHCDVVTQVDAQGFDAIGGNVLQSVTLRRLDFAPGTRRLDPSYQPAGCVAGTPGCVDRHMSRQPWSLLLQWR